MFKGFRPKNSRLLLLFVVFMLVFGFFVYKSPENAKKIPVGVLFIGDSITYGWNYYPHILPYYFGDSVVIQGLGGMDTIELYNMLLPTRNFRSYQSIPWYAGYKIGKTPYGKMHLALKDYQPRVIVLEIGVNNWLRTLVGQNEEQIQGYRASRSYKNLKLDDIQEDAAIGSINKRGVYQIIMRIKDLYGKNMPVVVVGAFPTYFVPNPSEFNALLKEFSEDKNSPVSNNNLTYLNPVPIARIGWSEEYKMFYDHDSFPAKKEQFNSIHVDWGHLNEKGYAVFAKMLECPVKKALGEWGKALKYKSCPVIGAADMNASLGKSLSK